MVKEGTKQQLKKKRREVRWGGVEMIEKAIRVELNKNK